MLTCSGTGLPDCVPAHAGRPQVASLLMAAVLSFNSAVNLKLLLVTSSVNHQTVQITQGCLTQGGSGGVIFRDAT